MTNDIACTENQLKSDLAKYILYDYIDNKIVKDVDEAELDTLVYDFDREFVYEVPVENREDFLAWLKKWYAAVWEGDINVTEKLKAEAPVFADLQADGVLRGWEKYDQMKGKRNDK